VSDARPAGGEANQQAPSRALVLQHISCEPPGVFADVLRSRGIAIETVELDQGGTLPDWRAADLLIVMGGPMGTYDEAEHPWLAEEKAWIAAAVRAGLPYLGVCLGAQLLAASLGANVRAGGAPEVGVLPVELTAGGLADPVLSVLGPRFMALQWHGDTFDLPAGAVGLAGSAAYPNQAMRFGPVAYGVQFHLEVTDEMFAQWGRVPAYAASARAALGPDGFEIMAADFAGGRRVMSQAAQSMLCAWLARAQAHDRRAGVGSHAASAARST
jgi:GMP synthase-like glutamine amidotransferase